MGNWILAALLAIAAVIGGVLAAQTDKMAVKQRDGYSHSVVGNMMVYRNAVTTYAQANPAVEGLVPDTSLALPAWFTRISTVKNYVNGGLGYVYYKVENDGQAYKMLKESDNDINVGISRGGFLYNPIAGTTLTALPAGVPEGAVVFAPAALNAASVVTPPTGSTTCTVGVGTTRSWTVSGNACVASVASARTLAEGGLLGFTDPAPGNTGTAGFTCSAGVLSTTPEPGATCVPEPTDNPCRVASGTFRTWIVGGLSCRGRTHASTQPLNMLHGETVTIISTNGNTGAAGYVCTNGSLSTTPDGSETCTTPAAACALPTPSTETDTENGTETQALPCPVGQTGEIIQSRPRTRTRTRTAYCPAPTGAYSWNDWSAWSSWTATGGWTTTTNTCVAIPCSGPSSQTQWTNASAACQAGYTGTHTWQKEQVQNRTCNAGTWSGWSSWTDTGNTRSDVNTCVVATCSGSSSQTQWVGASQACPAGYTGNNTWDKEQIQSRTCNSGTWSGYGAWSDTGNTRNVVNTCAPATCSGPSSQTQWVGASAACQAGYAGSHTWEKEQVQSRTCNLGTWSGWTSWSDTGGTRNVVNTCAPATCSGPNSQTQWVSSFAACPSGYSGSNTWEREQIQTRTCNAGTWSGYGAWTDTGVTRNQVNTCALICTPPQATSVPISRNQPNENQNVACPVGQTGAHTQTRTVTEAGNRVTTWTCPGPTSSTSDVWTGSFSYGSWTTVSNTCTPAGGPGGGGEDPTFDYGCDFTSLTYGSTGFESGSCNWDPGAYWQDYATVRVGDSHDAFGRPVLNTTLYSVQMTPVPGWVGATCFAAACSIDFNAAMTGSDGRAYTRIRVTRKSDSKIVLDTTVDTDFSNQ